MNPISLIRTYLPQATPPGAPPGAIPPAQLQALKGGELGASGDIRALKTGSFADVLGEMVREVSSKQAHSAQMVQDLQSGQNVSLHQAMIAMEEASVSFQLMVEVRNKLLESYQELMRMQV